MTTSSSSSSGFIAPTDFSSEWRDITLAHSRTHTLIYTATRYGRRFLLKAPTQDVANLTDYRLQQEREFQLGIRLVHPNIAATYSLEEINGVGRCIVQEWIDGVTLLEWMQTRPVRAAQERVLAQLLDALEYIHSLQLVHHDLKADNILITRNGANVKLIDFGLSATDATLSPVSNDPRKDIAALGRLLPRLVPDHYRLIARRCRKGTYPNRAALRKDIDRYKRFSRLLPVFLSAVLLGMAVMLFYISWHERREEQQRFEAMTALVESYVSDERDCLMAIINRYDSFDVNNREDMQAYHDCSVEYNACIRAQWTIRDSLVNLYDENDPYREQLWHLWMHRETELLNELNPLLPAKLNTN